MTFDEFVNSYAENSSMTLDQLRALGAYVQTCACGEHSCAGWAMMFRPPGFVTVDAAVDAAVDATVDTLGAALATQEPSAASETVESPSPESR